MRKNISRIVLFLMLLLCCDHILGIVIDLVNRKAFEKSPNDMPIERAYRGVGSDVVIVGSSRAKRHYVSSIMSDSLGYSVYNCGNDGAYFLYQTCVIDAILKSSTPKMIIWNLEPCDLFERDNDEVRISVGKLDVVYGDNSYTDSVLFSIDRYRWLKLQSNCYRYNSLLLYYIRRILYADIHNDNGYGANDKDGYKYPTKIVQSTTQPYSKDNERVFVNTLDKCSACGVELVIVFSPCFVESDYRVCESYNSIVNILSDRAIDYIDYYEDSRFMQDSTLFKNTDHLNHKGAVLFTKLVVSHLKILKCDD